MALWTPEQDRALLAITESNPGHTHAQIAAALTILGGTTVTEDSVRNRLKRIRQAQPDFSPMAESDIQQAVRNNVKMARSVIRLRHSIEADDELTRAVPAIRLALQTQAQTGCVTGLGYDELRQLIYGE